MGPGRNGAGVDVTDYSHTTLVVVPAMLLRENGYTLSAGLTRIYVDVVVRGSTISSHLDFDETLVAVPLADVRLETPRGSCVLRPSRGARCEDERLEYAAAAEPFVTLPVPTALLFRERLARADHGALIYASLTPGDAVVTAVAVGAYRPFRTRVEMVYLGAISVNGRVTFATCSPVKTEPMPHVKRTKRVVKVVNAPLRRCAGVREAGNKDNGDDECEASEHEAAPAIRHVASLSPPCPGPFRAPRIMPPPGLDPP